MILNRPFRVGLACSLIALGASGGLADDKGEPPHAPPASGWRQHDVQRPKPKAVEPGESPVGVSAPKDAVVLFDGSNLDAWVGRDGKPAAWNIVDGALEVAPGKGAIRTKESFGDVQIHLEWASPNPPQGRGQGRGNSGIFLMGAFEVQILDSHENETYADGMAGALYGQYPPLYNAAKAPGEWQTYDIAFRAPRFDDEGELLEPARVTVFHNGVLIQNSEGLIGRTSWIEALPYEKGVERGPIELQDHRHPTRFRNIWLRELPERVEPKSEEESRTPKAIDLATDELEAFAGEYTTRPDGKGSRMRVIRRGDYLTFRNPVRPIEARLVPISPLHFEMSRTDGRLIFQKDDQGRVTGARLFIGDSGGSQLTRVDQ